MKVKKIKTIRRIETPSESHDISLAKNFNFFANGVLVHNCTSLYSDGYFHARSVSSRDHPSRHWVKSLHGSISWMIPEGWRICGENLFAKHSIFYKDLKSYFYVFLILDQDDNVLSWDDTVDFCRSLGLETVPVLYRGMYDEDVVKSCYSPDSCILGGEQEGYVVRSVDEFYLDRTQDHFGEKLAKFVRADHVQTSDNWLHQTIIPNLLTNGM
jgi:hypothetical protein